MAKCDATPIDIYTGKKLEKFSRNCIELYADELVVVENTESAYTDLAVQVYFSEEMLGDPTIFNNEEMEESPLGTLSNYRCKIMVNKNSISQLYFTAVS